MAAQNSSGIPAVVFTQTSGVLFDSAEKTHLVILCVSAVKNAFTAKAQRVQRFFSLVILCVSTVE
jgi:hypothetical protein